MASEIDAMRTAIRVHEEHAAAYHLLALRARCRGDDIARLWSRAAVQHAQDARWLKRDLESIERWEAMAQRGLR